MTQEREAGRSYSCRRSIRGGSYQMRKKHDYKSLPESSRQSVRQISVSLITQKSRWYKLGISSLLIRRSHVLTAPHTPRRRHLQLSPSIASQPSCTTTGPPTVKKLLLLVIILIEVRPLEASSGVLLGSMRSERTIEPRGSQASHSHCVIIGHRLA